MQCQQPLFGISLPYPGQHYPSHSVNPFNGFAPDVIGEGEVNSITFPDGSIQYYFLPVRWQSDIYLKRWPPFPFNDNMFYNYSKPNPGLWIIKNFSNTISPVYNQYWQRTNPDPFTKPCFTCDSNAMPSGFQLKFHNDCWTSTTDLHCFCPCIPPAPLIVSTAAQVETPIEMKFCCEPTDYNCSGHNAGCMLNIRKECNKIISRCKCNRIEKKSSSCMSIDQSKTCKAHDSKKRESRKNAILCASCTDDVKKKSSEKNNQPCEKHSQHTKPHSNCNCEDAMQNTEETYGQTFAKNFKVQTADKFVVTCNDQASSVPPPEGQTQTDCRCWSATDVKERRKPKTTHNRRRRQSSDKILGVYEPSSSSSCCTICKSDTKCNSDTSRDRIN